MKSFLFYFLSLAILCQTKEVITYRYTDGTLTRDTNVSIIDGSMFETIDDKTETVQYAGIDKNRVPFMIIATGKTSEANAEVQLECLFGAQKTDKLIKLKGTAKIVKTEQESKIEGKCTAGLEVWQFNSIIRKEGDLYYPPAEAGKRAEFLIDASTTDFNAANLIYYSILDYPYVKSSCAGFLDDRYPKVDKAEAGAIIVGEDGKHCAIANEDGTKFIQSKAGTKKIVELAIGEVEKEFGVNVLYKKYPVSKVTSSISR